MKVKGSKELFYVLIIGIITYVIGEGMKELPCDLRLQMITPMLICLGLILWRLDKFGEANKKESVAK